MLLNKCDEENYTPLMFKSTNVQLAGSQRHFGLTLDSKLNFNEHIESKSVSLTKKSRFNEKTILNSILKELVNNIEIFCKT